MTCNDCGAKKLGIWFESKANSRVLCDKCFLAEGRERVKKK